MKITSKRQVGGSLNKYAKNVKSDISFREVKDKAWEEVVRKKITKAKKLGFSEPSS